MIINQNLIFGFFSMSPGLILHRSYVLCRFVIEFYKNQIGDDVNKVFSIQMFIFQYQYPHIWRGKISFLIHIFENNFTTIWTYSWTLIQEYNKPAVRSKVTKAKIIWKSIAAKRSSCSYQLNPQRLLSLKKDLFK